MVQIGNKLVSMDLFEKKFMCNLGACKGACCVQGDAGAPLKEEEKEILESEYENFSYILSKEGREAIENNGKWVVDEDGDIVTPLNNGKECAYTIFEKGIAKCGIEHAWGEGRTRFRKPESCHLYPIRVTKLGSHLAVNYHTWEVCKPAVVLGHKRGTPVYIFLKDPITRAFGEDFYKELELIDQTLKEQVRH